MAHDGRPSFPLLSISALALFLSACGSKGDAGAPLLTGWAAIRATAAPQVVLTAEFGAPAVQPIALDGWEDGLFMSRDGLHLYAVYVPADLLSFTLAGADQTHAADYFRGPTLGMDMTTNFSGLSAWIHGSIIHATRSSVAQPFGPWQLTAMDPPVFSEGAVTAQGTGSNWDLFVYTSNQVPPYNSHIYLSRNVPFNPAGGGVILPSPVTSAGLATMEDNPHIERISATDLVLFFDSDDRVGGVGGRDIWYAISGDDGATWTAPIQVSTVNQVGDEEQPHLYRDGSGAWWLYFAATNTVDGKLAIYRASQGTVGDWNSWGSRQLVVAAGNTEGVGEPTLTSAGDLSFVVIIKDAAHGTATNRYDADPWFAPHRPSATGSIERMGHAFDHGSFATRH